MSVNITEESTLYESMLIHSERGTYFLGSANPILSEKSRHSLPERDLDTMALQSLRNGAREIDRSGSNAFPDCGAVRNLGPEEKIWPRAADA
jgi:hypothetical protein